MAVIFSDGFESGNFNAWTATSGSPTVVESPVHHGNYAFQATNLAAWAAQQAYKTITGQSTIFARMPVQFADMPTNTYLFPLELRRTSIGKSTYIGLKNVAGDYRWVIRFNDATDYTSGSNVGDVSGAYHCLEAKFVASATVGELHLYIDGTEVITQTGLDTGTATVDRIMAEGYSYNKAQNTTINIDCVVVADAYIGVEPSGQQLFTLINQEDY